MVKCRVCIEETGQSRQFELINFHLLKAHGMLPKEYRQLYPSAKFCNNKFREKSRCTMQKVRKKYPDLYKRSIKWKKTETLNNEHTHTECTLDNIEGLSQRVKWLGLTLATGIKGEEYKKTCNEYKRLVMLRDDVAEAFFRKEEANE